MAVSDVASATVDAASAPNNTPSPSLPFGNYSSFNRHHVDPDWPWLFCLHRQYHCSSSTSGISSCTVRGAFTWDFSTCQFPWRESSCAIKAAGGMIKFFAKTKSVNSPLIKTGIERHHWATFLAPVTSCCSEVRFICVYMSILVNRWRISFCLTSFNYIQLSSFSWQALCTAEK